MRIYFIALRTSSFKIKLFDMYGPDVNYTRGTELFFSASIEHSSTIQMQSCRSLTTLV